MREGFFAYLTVTPCAGVKPAGGLLLLARITIWEDEFL